MQILGLVWGILALVGLFAAFAPFLGALNWLLIPFAVIGAIFCAIATGLAYPGNRGKSTAGLICCSLAALFGFVRLVLGLGVV